MRSECIREGRLVDALDIYDRASARNYFTRDETIVILSGVPVTHEGLGEPAKQFSGCW